MRLCLLTLVWVNAWNKWLNASQCPSLIWEEKHRNSTTFGISRTWEEYTCVNWIISLLCCYEVNWYAGTSQQEMQQSCISKKTKPGNIVCRQLFNMTIYMTQLFVIILKMYSSFLLYFTIQRNGHLLEWTQLSLRKMRIPMTQ